MIEMTQTKGNVLLIDDLPENLQLLNDLLVQLGYNVRCVTNSAMAFKTLRAKRPDVILLDIKMPDMDGYELCTALKADEYLADIPVIFVSAACHALDKVKAFRCGGVDYITKPFEVEEVVVRLENQLTIQRQRIVLQREIRKRQEAEEVLQQSRALLSSVLNTSPDGIAALEAVRDPQTGEIEDFRCLVVNPVIAKAFNRSREELIGKIVLRKFLNRINPDLFDDLAAVVETGRPFIKDIYHPSEELFWYHLSAVKLGDGFSLTVRDITERKKTELELQLANRELRLLASVDGLTKIANRRCFDEMLKNTWMRLGSSQQPLSLLMLDVDFFKSYNDIYGHQQGDECLSLIAQTLQKVVVRPADLVARYGGEEFAVILPETSNNGAMKVAEAIRHAVSTLAISHQGSTFGYVTVSIGVCCLTPVIDFSPDYLISLTDHALYLAKQHGRNCCIYTEGC